MELNELLADLFGRIDEHVHEVLDLIDPALLTAAPVEGANPIGWLIWHLTRVQDSHIAELVEEDQVWVTGDWGAVFGVPSDPANHGYGHSAEDVAAIRPESVLVLLEYYRAVAVRTRTFLGSITTADLNRIVDPNWDPPVSLGVRLISIADDDMQHAGQAAYVRGLLER